LHTKIKTFQTAQQHSAAIGSSPSPNNRRNATPAPDSRSLVAQLTHRGWYPTTERTWFMEESGNEDVSWAPGVYKPVTAVLREADRRAPELTPRPLHSRCGPPSPSVFLPSAAAAI
jgi:hypothetical protein